MTIVSLAILLKYYFSFMFYLLVSPCDFVSLSGTCKHWINQLVWSIITVILIFVGEFPGEPVVRIPHFTAKGLDKIPACGARIPQAVQHSLHCPPTAPPKKKIFGECACDDLGFINDHLSSACIKVNTSNDPNSH